VSFGPSWGRLGPLLRPAPGNHEYLTSDGTGYFDYFGTRAGERGRGWYSYDLGTWHLVALNSNCAAIGGCGPGSPQLLWLENDLAAHPRACTLAYWHHPLFTSSQNGPQSFTRAFWTQLYAAGADVVLGGHDHVYEVFQPQDPDGRLDLTRGIREFVVGTGGAFLYQFPTRAANSQRQLAAFGLLKLTLNSESYDWQFVQVNGATGDSGTGQCH
jgi:3',5'-cyclic AMP phosphodiesterase CpdA